MFIKESTLDDLMRRVLGKLVKSKARLKASRGGTKELRSVLLRLSNPRARLSHTERKGKIFSGLGELLWYLAKSNDLEFISYYLERYRDESEDGRTIHGAYGPRLYGLRQIDQVSNVLDLLTEKPGSRRAVIQLFDAEDLQKSRREIPCTCTLQFMVRDGRLELATCMRSNDAFKGLPHDVFSFTMIQEIVATILGYKLGSYSHFVGSLHLYDDDVEKARQYLDEGWQPTKNVAMPRMPSGDPRPSIVTVLHAEATLRRDDAVVDAVRDLAPYWRDLVRLLEIYGHVKRNRSARIPSIRRAMASPVYKEYITRREPPKRTVPRTGQPGLPFHDSAVDDSDDAEG